MHDHSRNRPTAGAPHRTARAPRLLLSVLLPALAGAVASGADARITDLTITKVESPAFGGMSFGSVGQYETLTGVAHGEVDPKDPRNAIITDIEFAPRNARGMVDYSMDVVITKPIDMGRGNATVLYDVPNRRLLDDALSRRPRHAEGVPEERIRHEPHLRDALHREGPAGCRPRFRGDA